MMEKEKIEKIRKRGRWIIIPLLVVVILIALIRTYYYPSGIPEKDALSRIYERGFLIALTNSNSLDYFIQNGQPMGYQLELLESLADYLKIPLKIIALNDMEKLYYYLDLNVADLFACNLPVTAEGKKLLHFSQPLGETRQVLIQRKPVSGKKNNHNLISQFKDLSRDTVHIIHSPFLKSLLRPVLRKAGQQVVLIEEKGLTPEELIRMVSQGKISYAICDENVALVAKRCYRNIDAGVLVTSFHPYAWGVKSSSDSLLRKVNAWMKEAKKKGEMKQIALSYFNNPRTNRYFYSDYFSVKQPVLSPFDGQIRELSKTISWDWRLLASLIYEESKFRTGLTSSHHATGLMQLMPETARKFGMDSASSPARQLLAGVKFIQWLNQQLLPEIIDRRERINFILASYNVGLGKVLAAREKAVRSGKDPNRWNNNVDYYLTRRKKGTIASLQDSGIDLSPYGTAGGFVANILERYHHYKNNLPQ
jgi:membrane-bound lytic murein transglycosylase F